MGSNYLITPKEFNGTDYNTLYFKTISQQVLLNDNMLATALGLSGTPNVDNALNGLKTYTDAELSDVLHFEITSYVGTGNGGSSYPCQISFRKAPKVVFFIGTIHSNVVDWNVWTHEDEYCKFVLYTTILTTSYTSGNGLGYNNSASDTYGKKSSDGKTIYWYSNAASGALYDQLNISGVTYYFLGVW